MISRRSLLGAAGVTLAAGFGVPSLFQASARAQSAAPIAYPLDMLRLGMAGYTFHKFPLDQTLGMLRKVDVHYLCIKDFHLPLKSTEDNLRAMAQAAKAAGARVLITGMQVPPNYGQRYGDDFIALFARVAKDEGAALVPFLLAGVADAPDADRLFQPDRIHPSAAAHPRILDNVWPVLKPLLGG